MEFIFIMENRHILHTWKGGHLHLQVSKYTKDADDLETGAGQSPQCSCWDSIGKQLGHQH